MGISTTPADRSLRSRFSASRATANAASTWPNTSQQIPEASLTHKLLDPYRADPDSVHSQLDQSLWNRPMITYGVERQKIFVLGFAPSKNAASHQIPRSPLRPAPAAIHATTPSTIR
ncbi:hypothetical protein [Streptomyces sp. Mg1]|uniref:hypothetical protein n=1 Tax=Streptomyces sp. Mg1 TaxID=465541 RepID=UPI00017E94D7|nr:hypothetical protein [Streptomyces sp. Mg1]EDX23641.1 hypothetical protein SSAG_03432 [Streptomyces sp. Mg1]